MLNKLCGLYHKLKPTTSALTQELLEKIDADRLLYQESQHLLLALLNTYRREILEKFENLKTNFMEKVSPPAPHTAGGADLSDKVDDVITALKKLQTIADSQETVSFLYPHIQQNYLGEISRLVSDFANSAEKLHRRCKNEHDLLVPACIEWYTEKAGNVCAETPRPRELTFRLHGLPRALNDLCRLSMCLNGRCMHVIIPDENQEMISVAVVHPEESWDDLRRYMFAAIKLVTLIDGEIFGLVTTAVVREKWSEKIIDEEAWKKEWMDLSEVDVIWPVEDNHDEYSQDSGSSMRRRSVLTMDQGSTNSRDMWGIPYETSSESENQSTAPVISSIRVRTEPSPSSSSASNSSSETMTSILKSRNSKASKSSTSSSSTVRFASTTPPAEITQERGGHSHLRRRIGTSSLRGPSFISPIKDDKKSETAVVTHPFLKRGAGANRKSTSALK